MITPGNTYHVILMKYKDGTVRLGSTILADQKKDDIAYNTRLHAQRVFGFDPEIEEVGYVSFDLKLNNDYVSVAKKAEMTT